MKYEKKPYISEHDIRQQYQGNKLRYNFTFKVKMEDFLVVAKKNIPNLIGLKFASKDLGDMIGCLFAGKFNILCGCDEVNFSIKHCMLLYFEI